MLFSENYINVLISINSMALKDWKKVQVNKNNFGDIVYIAWKSKKAYPTVLYRNYVKDYYRVEIIDSKTGNTYYEKSFKTKSACTNFLKNYFKAN